MESKKKKDNDFNVEIGLKNGKEWSDDKLAKVKAFVKSHSDKRTPDRKLKNEMLTIKYQMEEYIENENINEKSVISLESFLGSFLEVLNLTFKKFASSIDTTDGNLKKYLSGDRKFNTDLALKFSSFFHTTPDLWLKVNIKNELLSLKKEKKQISKYKKYNYEKVLA
jgi:plasmid maintenance system antidote protein VapI